MRILKGIEKNFGLLLLTSAILSFIFPRCLLWARDYTDELLMLSLFFGCLRVDFSEIFQLKKRFGKLIVFVLFDLVVLPAIFYIISFGLDQQIRIGLFLLFAISGAMATPLLASILDLEILWSTAFVILTSALVPITVPFLIKLLFGISIHISVLEMILFLAKIITIPTVLAICLKQSIPKFVATLIPFSGIAGSLIVAVFVGAIVAVNQDFLASRFLSPSTSFVLMLLFGLFLSRFLIGFFISSTNSKEKWTNSLMFGTMNNGLTLLLAAKFFTEQVLFVVLLSEIPWILAQPIFQKVATKFYRH